MLDRSMFLEVVNSRRRKRRRRGKASHSDKIRSMNRGEECLSSDSFVGRAFCSENINLNFNDENGQRLQLVSVRGRRLAIPRRNSAAEEENGYHFSDSIARLCRGAQLCSWIRGDEHKCTSRSALFVHLLCARLFSSRNA